MSVVMGLLGQDGKWAAGLEVTVENKREPASGTVEEGHQYPRLSSDVYVVSQLHTHLPFTYTNENEPAVCTLGLLPKKLCGAWLDALDGLKLKTERGWGSVVGTACG